jgi:hypothetical protein
MTQSLASPFFLSNAEDLARRLEASPLAEAQKLAAEAKDLIALFRTWATSRPTDDARVAGIGRLLELNRRAMDFMARQGPPSSGARPPVSSDRSPPSTGRPSFPHLSADDDGED